MASKHVFRIAHITKHGDHYHPKRSTILNFTSMTMPCTYALQYQGVRQRTVHLVRGQGHCMRFYISSKEMVDPIRSSHAHR